MQFQRLWRCSRHAPKRTSSAIQNCSHNCYRQPSDAKVWLYCITGEEDDHDKLCPLTAFTGEQIATFAHFMDTSPLLTCSPASSISGRSSRRDLHTPDSEPLHNSSVLRATVQAQHSQGLQHGPFDVLAREFGVETQLVEAL